MSYPFAPPVAAGHNSIDWEITALAWRGTILDLFARAEYSIDECLAQLREAGFDPGPDIHHPGARTRNRALSDLLERDSFTGHAPSCIKKLASWRGLLKQRAMIAHGEMTVTAQGASFRYREHRGKSGAVPHDITLTRMEMLALLARLRADQLRLHQQLGQIKAAAKRGS